MYRHRKILMGALALALPVGTLVAFTSSAGAKTLKPPTVACTGMSASLGFSPALTAAGTPAAGKTSTGQVSFGGVSFTGCTEQGNPVKQDVEVGTFTGSVSGTNTSTSAAVKLPHVPHQPPAFVIALCSSFLNAKSSSKTLKGLGTLTVNWSGAPGNVTQATSLQIKKASGGAVQVPGSSPPMYNIIFGITVKATGQFKAKGSLTGVIDEADSDSIFAGCSSPVPTAAVITGVNGNQASSSAAF